VVTLAVELPPPAVGPEEVRRVVTEVLSRPEFAGAAPSLAARVRGWVAEQIGRLIEAVAGTGGASLVGSLLLTAAVVVAVVLALRFARGLRPDPALAPVTADRVGRQAADWAAEADAHAREGRLREALRCRYRALVAALAAAGAVDETPGRTTGEYLAEVARRRPDAVSDVAAVTAAFDASWYGHARVDETTLDEVRRRTDAVRAALGRHRPVAAPAAGGRR